MPWRRQVLADGVKSCTIAFVGFLIATQIGFKLMVHEGFVDPSWLCVGQRLRRLIPGGAMVIFGNLLRTFRSPWPHQHEPFAWQQVHRFVGWTFVSGGLGGTGRWTFLPAASALRSSLKTYAVVFTLAPGRKLASLMTRSYGFR